MVLSGAMWPCPSVGNTSVSGDTDTDHRQDSQTPDMVYTISEGDTWGKHQQGQTMTSLNISTVQCGSLSETK